MIHHSGRIIEIVAVLSTFFSICYYTLCLWSAAGFLRERKQAGEACAERSRSVAYSTEARPPVTILKPLRGTDPEMYESFRSHCLQDYPEYEIIFGVSDPGDAAVGLVERLKKEFPQRAIRLMVCPKNLGTNTKVSNLAQMLPEARYEYLIVNDSDIRLKPDYLRRVLAPLADPLADPKIGMVTCLYRGLAGPTLGSRLESIGISTDFSAGILAARNIEGGLRFGLGSTLAFRRRDLESIGGFEALVDYLADDYELGSRIAGQGLGVKLSEVVVETFLPPYTLSEFVDHQLRWARGVRDSRPWGYIGLGLTFGLPWAVLALAFAHGAAWAWELLVAVSSMRVAVALVVGRLVLRDCQVLPLLGLLPTRDVVASLIWLVSFTGHTVSWRGDSFELKKGKLARIGS
jgi:ceramide glucosyltransferase